MDTESITRRDLFRGGARPDPVQIVRPPWSDEESIRSACTTCGKCIAACPEGILRADETRKPQVDFAAGGCTFCGDCAGACEEPVFDVGGSPPWHLGVDIGSGCLLKSGVACQLCTDFCDAGALTFNMSARPVGAIAINEDLCTGCGTCIAACPVTAISSAPPGQETIL